MIELHQNLFEIKNIGPKFLSKLKKLKIETVKDLLWHFPNRYEDFSQIYKIKDLIPGQEATIQGKIKEISWHRTWQKNFYLLEALISDETGSIRAVWFNQPYLKNILRPGKIANFSGKVSISNQEIYLANPVYELISPHQIHHETKHTGRIIPIYPETKGLTSKGIRYLIKPILDKLPPLTDPIPKEILEKENLPELNQALKNIHFPENLEEALRAKKRFAFEYLFLLQLHNLSERFKIAAHKAFRIKIDLEEIKKIIQKIPFELTFSQKKVLWEILKDIEKDQPMNRLLQGDVGSGKTVIAALVAIYLGLQDYQTAFMAPTEVLARQHYQTFKKFFKDFEKGIALLTRSESKIFYGHQLETKISKKKLNKEIEEAKIKIVIGTHALIQKDVKFSNLALVVIDEQHRFGVNQRSALIKKPIQEKSKIQPIPHFLSMSATPIPRTLALTIFGDLDLSLITELPKNRKPIITKIVDPKNRDKAYAFIRGQVKKGRQAFVICPRIGEEKEKQEISQKTRLNLEVKSVKEEYEKLAKKVFPDLKVGMLHGKMKPKEKEEIMNKFLERKIDILIATSVIEVGIDVPNATIMMIEGAERFGLAQLYQFRGRVGRGEHQSFCFLFTESNSKKTQERLKSIIEAKNGLELAEKDLKIRGPGEFLGEAQTGMPDLAMKALQNPELIKKSREAAYEILKKDPYLKNYPLLKEKLAQFKKEVHLE